MKGDQNGPVDVLSRLHMNALHVELNVIIDFKELAAVEENDTKLFGLKSSPSSLVLRDMPLPMSDSTIVCDVSTDVPLPYVTLNFRGAVFNSLHSLSHPGIWAMQRLVTA